MVMKSNNDVKIDGQDEEEKMPPQKDANDVCVKYSVEEEKLVVRRALDMHAKVDASKSQRDNIFHTRYHVQNKVRILITNGASFTNIANTKLIEKLNLHTTKHPILYKLHCFNDNCEMKMNKQVLVAFSIGKYHDKVLCDVVLMQASHLLPGRP